MNEHDRNPPILWNKKGRGENVKYNLQIKDNVGI